MALRCMIVDDEPLAIEILQAYVERVPSLELVATSTNAIQAFEKLKEQPVDLLFLDIQMPKLTGIDFLKVLSPLPKVVFTTAYREYAVESYELNVVDYLLKPIAFDRFMMAINKVVENGSVAVAKDLEEKDPDPFIFLKSDRKMVKVGLAEIAYVESLKDYVRVKKMDGTEVVSLQKISYMEQKLPSDCFKRVHKSYIVSLKNIDSFSSNEVEVAGKMIPIGRSYKSEVLESLEKIS